MTRKTVVVGATTTCKKQEMVRRRPRVANMVRKPVTHKSNYEDESRYNHHGAKLKGIAKIRMRESLKMGFKHRKKIRSESDEGHKEVIA